jgi:hypothetical protein
MAEDPNERLIENREVFRRANEELDASASQMGLTGPRPYLCECNDTRCTRTMTIDGGIYSSVRANPDRFVVLPGHEEGLEVVDDSNDGYVVVKRRG